MIYAKISVESFSINKSCAKARPVKSCPSLLKPQGRAGASLVPTQFPHCCHTFSLVQWQCCHVELVKFLSASMNRANRRILELYV